MTVASPLGAAAPIDPRSYPDPASIATAHDPLARLNATYPLAALRAADFDAVFLPGGHGGAPETMLIILRAQGADEAAAFGPTSPITAAVSSRGSRFARGCTSPKHNLAQAIAAERAQFARPKPSMEKA